MIKAKEETGEEDRQVALAKGLILAPEFREVHHPLGIIKMCLRANTICKANAQREKNARIGIHQFVHTGKQVRAITGRNVFSFTETLPKLRQHQRRSRINLIRRKVIVRNHPKQRQISLINEAGRKVKRKTLHLAPHLRFKLRKRFQKL